MEKRNIFSIITFNLLLILSLNKTFGQASSAGLTGFPNAPNTAGVDYLGWDNTVGVPLDIKHENSQL